jgi:3-oxoacyl-[acyl-carrier protein] reductase
MEIKGKNIIITGGLGAFGNAIADALTLLDANIFIFDLCTNKKYTCFQVDVSDETQVADALKNIEKIDILINCAGEIYSEMFINFMAKGDKKHSRGSWDRIVNNNLTSVFNMSVQAAEKMISKRTKGLIINFSSISARGNAGQAAYASAKAGVEAMTKVIAKELGMFKIRVVAIAPGFIDTDSTRKSLSESTLDYWLKQTPLRELGKVEDIVKTVEYIIKCDYLSGCTINVDGALSI